MSSYSEKYNITCPKCGESHHIRFHLAFAVGECLNCGNTWSRDPDLDVIT